MKGKKELIIEDCIKIDLSMENKLDPLVSKPTETLIGNNALDSSTVGVLVTIDTKKISPTKGNGHPATSSKFLLNNRIQQRFSYDVRNFKEINTKYTNSGCENGEKLCLIIDIVSTSQPDDKGLFQNIKASKEIV